MSVRVTPELAVNRNVGYSVIVHNGVHNWNTHIINLHVSECGLFAPMSSGPPLDSSDAVVAVFSGIMFPFFSPVVTQDSMLRLVDC